MGGRGQLSPLPFPPEILNYHLLGQKFRIIRAKRLFIYLFIGVNIDSPASTQSVSPSNPFHFIFIIEAQCTIFFYYNCIQ